MKEVMLGNHAVSHGARLSRVDVIAAYPITPQTLIVEKLSELCADGDLDAKFIKVESEHSAMAACIGAEAVGARAFTATSAQGLALMHELLHWASGARLPIVMADVNRAMAPGWSIWTEQTDSLAQRDTGWLQFYCENNQEVLDTVIMAYRIAEQILLPVMIVLDAFILSHTNEIVDVPDQALVDGYLPPYKPEYKMDVNNPHAFGALITPDNYMEMRFKIHEAMQQAKDVAVKADQEFKAVFGRSYGVVEPYRLDDADTVLISAGATTSMLRIIVDHYREKGEKIGLLKLKMFRPFPTEIVRRLLAGRKKIGVLDRNISFGATGIFFQETKAALYPDNKSGLPVLFGYIMGLGGRDITLQSLEEMVDHMLTHDKPEEDSIWIGLKK
ncbi:pyruvate synthase subunit PorA [bacterium BMS3Abin05]|nr:pyruvate synthase subunit PorA [bacterium BMS3Abin05]HDK36500.1 pyruvate ferredoxin oxidoreductase [Bacteroidota bacterium]HDZ10948.1 pyruvate ferredoxin oxidoreductase [Bacteroidota bacterium]